MAIVHERIKKLRTSKMLTLARVAEYLQVTEATAQRYETGKGIKAIPYDVVEKYANLFNCSPAYLMGWSENEIDTVAAEHEESMSDLASLDAIADAEERAKNIEQWKDSMGDVVFTDEEMAQLIDYAKFIISKRKE